ncbi:MAG: DUF4199 domain-containing protein [Ignavibacteria bacterium]|nr:DUF4199 domain-containing protein [Ignavibacteria bacterium]
MTRQSLKYGSIAGIIMAVIFFIPFVLFKGQDLYNFFLVGEIIGYSTMILSLLFVFFGIRSYRDVELGGVITFGKAFITGLFITLIASIIFGIFTILLYTVISPNLGNEMIEFYKRSIVESGQAKDIIDAQISEMESNRGLYNNAAFNGFLMFATVFLIGAVVALISSFILKRKTLKN